MSKDKCVGEQIQHRNEQQSNKRRKRLMIGGTSAALVASGVGIYFGQQAQTHREQKQIGQVERLVTDDGFKTHDLIAEYGDKQMPMGTITYRDTVRNVPCSIDNVQMTVRKSGDNITDVIGYEAWVYVNPEVKHLQVGSVPVTQYIGEELDLKFENQTELTEQLGNIPCTAIVSPLF